MKYIADLHIHSKYSRATSKDMDLEGITHWAKLKGIDVVATGDFTHPVWFAELKDKLKPAEQGFYGFNGCKFVLSVEISSIYKKGDKVRKVHNLVYVPSLTVAEKINLELGKIGNIKSDGRPILGLDCEKLAEIVFGISQNNVIVPAHAWTPWFSVFGSKSGFDSLEECFGQYTEKVFAIETGLSSDPLMNWRLSQLDNISLISCSDAHSPAKLGREVCVFDTEFNYDAMWSAVRDRDSKRFLFTVEFFPEEGKYHFDGHRECKIRWSPVETKAHNGKCSVCGKPVTVGVCNRVAKLADRVKGPGSRSRVPFRRMIPLQEIIAEALGQGVNTKSVQAEYLNAVNMFENEFKVLLDVPEKELRKRLPERIAEGVVRVRLGQVKIEPGYDGEYGKVKLF